MTPIREKIRLKKRLTDKEYELLELQLRKYTIHILRYSELLRELCTSIGVDFHKAIVAKYKKYEDTDTKVFKRFEELENELNKVRS